MIAIYMRKMVDDIRLKFHPSCFISPHILPDKLYTIKVVEDIITYNRTSVQLAASRRRSDRTA